MCVYVLGPGSVCVQVVYVYVLCVHAVFVLGSVC